MTRQLVLVHGRSQEMKDAFALKAEWLEALDEGLQKSGLRLPIPESDVRFPYYGDTLYEMVEGESADVAADVIVRGAGADTDQKRFMRAVLEEVRNKVGITDEQVAKVSGQDVVDRGPLNWEWLQGILRAIDRYVPFGSGVGIALATYDVYQYLKNSALRTKIEDGVSRAVKPGVDAIMVGHSLGTVVTYNMMRLQGRQLGWKIPLYVTVGSPLGVTEIRATIKGFAPICCPEPVGKWFNAMDERDVVALYPLDVTNFPLNPATPAIENKLDVRNRTRNRHGIAGYLDDKEVAKRIHDALVE